MGFPRWEYWSGLLRPPWRDLPNPGIEPCLLIVWLNLELCPHLPGFWRPCLLFFIIYFFPLQPYWGAALSRFSYVWLFATLWTLVCQAPMSMRFSRQEYWTGLLFPPPGDLPDPGIEPGLLWLRHCRQILYHWATGEASVLLFMDLLKSRSWHDGPTLEGTTG